MVAHTTVSVCGFNKGLAQGIRPRTKLRVFTETFFSSNSYIYDKKTLPLAKRSTLHSSHL